jgi:hypothetical protein
MVALGIALWLIGLLAARLIHPASGWFAVFAALSIRGIDYFAIDARSYALGIMMASASLYFLVRWLDSTRWVDGGADFSGPLGIGDVSARCVGLADGGERGEPIRGSCGDAGDCAESICGGAAVR